METIFSLVNLLVLPFWALMIFAPFWRWTERIIRSPWIALPPAVVYALLLGSSVFGVTGGTNASDVLAGLANPTAAGIGQLLGTPFGATVAWAHFLAFDLFVGRWVFLEARSRRLTHWLTAPILFLTFMLGPLGLLTFLLVRSQTTDDSSQMSDVSSQRSGGRDHRPSLVK